MGQETLLRRDSLLNSSVRSRNLSEITLDQLQRTQAQILKPKIKVKYMFLLGRVVKFIRLISHHIGLSELRAMISQVRRRMC